MNTRLRLSIILIAIIVCLIFVWPNIGTRTINVHFLPGLNEQQIQAAADGISLHLSKRYPNRYIGQVTEIKNENNVPVKVYQIHGRWVQTAFLNELGRLENVNSEKIEIEPLWIEENLKANPFKLGLDLQGGMNLLLEADFDKLKRMIETQYPPNHIAELEKKLAETPDPAEKEKLQGEINQVKQLFDFSPAKRKEYVLGAKEIIRSRIDRFGVSEPLLRTQDDNKIEISLPGVRSPEQAKKLIASTARVEYRLAEPAGDQGKYTILANKYFNDYVNLTSEIEKHNFIQDVEKKIKLPADYTIFVHWQIKPQGYIDANNKFKNQKRIPTNFMVLERKVALSGDDISPKTYAYRDPDDFTAFGVSMTMTTAGAKKFGELTSNNRGRLLAIIIDDKIVSAPRINDPILSGQAQITGSFDATEAQDLALIIKEGALPVPLKIVEERAVGPTLGKESIDKGVKAIFLGLIGVAIFMILYYHAAGFVAIVGLALNLLFIAAILALMKFTITLPGLAGIVLTLGMIVDANVIIYERIREELGRGKSLKLAISQGFDRATWTILDSNLTTILAAIVLLRLGSGPIKGFALTLFIGILTSLFTSLYATRTIMYMLAYDFNIKNFSLGWKTYMKNTES